MTGSDFAEQARLAILNSYDIRGDAGALRRMLRLPAPEQPAYFSALRQDYRLRREFSSLTLELRGPACRQARQFRQLGFRVASV
ncbi:MAG: DUF3410 domain-containing protein [Gammaproteobacteria bacterium]|nr:DUF3410 domain-containing protein [Gammaproteobacteria bacterium]